MAELRIGQLASRAGVGVETIRFYERSGLIEDPPRSESGYRRYSEEAVHHVRFIRRVSRLGFSLDEVREILDLRLEATGSLGDVRRKVEAKIRAMDARIADLQRIREALASLAGRCTGEGPVSDCPILEALDAGEAP